MIGTQQGILDTRITGVWGYRPIFNACGIVFLNSKKMIACLFCSTKPITAFIMSPRTVQHMHPLSIVTTVSASNVLDATSSVSIEIAPFGRGKKSKQTRHENPTPKKTTEVQRRRRRRRRSNGLQLRRLRQLSVRKYHQTSPTVKAQAMVRSHRRDVHHRVSSVQLDKIK